MSARLARAGGAVLFGKAASYGFLFLASAIFARTLGPAQYGVFSVALAVLAGTRMLVDFGLNTALVRFAARHIAAAEFFATALRAKLLAGAGILLLTLLFANPLAGILQLQVPALLILAVLGGVLFALYDHGTTVLQTRQQFTARAIFEALEGVFIIAGALLVIFAFPTSFGATGVFAAAAALSAITVLAFSKQFHATPRLMRLATLFRLGTWAMVATTAGWAIFRIDILFLGYFLSAESVGHYAAANTLAFGPVLLTATLNILLYPKAAAYGSQERLRAYVLRSLSVTIPAAVVLAALALLIANPLVTLIFGGAYIEAIPLFRILVLAFLFAIITTPITLLVYIIDLHREFTAIKLAALASLIIGFPLIIPFSGLFGAAIFITLVRIVDTGITSLLVLRTLMPFGARPRDSRGREGIRIGMNGRALQRAITGIERYVQETLTALLAIDTRNAYVLFQLGGKTTARLPDAQNLTVLHSRPLHGRLQRIMWDHFGVRKLMRGNALDVFHGPAFALPFFKPRGTKYVVTIHDLAYLHNPESYTLLNRTYLRIVVPLMLRMADAVVTVSASTKRELIDIYSVPAERVKVIPHGVGPHFNPVPRARANATVTARIGKRPFILSVGTLIPRKNYEGLIDAFARCKSQGLPHQLVIVGKKGWLYEDIYRAVRAHGLERDVKFIGYLPDAELPAFYTAATAFVMPSFHEGFGMPVLEAMACGCPVITSNTSALPGLTGNAAILIDPARPSAIARAIHRVALDEALRARLSRAGKRRAKQFTWNSSARALLSLYTDLARK